MTAPPADRSGMTAGECRQFVTTVLGDPTYLADPVERRVLLAVVDLADALIVELDGDGAFEAVGFVFAGEEYWWLGPDDGGWDGWPPFFEMTARLLDLLGTTGPLFALKAALGRVPGDTW